MKGRFCLTNLVFFYNITHLVDVRKAVDIVYMDFRKAFNSVSQNLLLEKLAPHDLDGCTVHYVKN